MEKAALLEKREGPGSLSGRGSRGPGRKGGVPGREPPRRDRGSALRLQACGEPRRSGSGPRLGLVLLPPRQSSRICRALGPRLSEVLEAGLGLEASGCPEVLRSPPKPWPEPEAASPAGREAPGPALLNCFVTETLLLLLGQLGWVRGASSWLGLLSESQPWAWLHLVFYHLMVLVSQSIPNTRCALPTGTSVAFPAAMLGYSGAVTPLSTFTDKNFCLG